MAIGAPLFCATFKGLTTKYRGAGTAHSRPELKAMPDLRACPETSVFKDLKTSFALMRTAISSHQGRSQCA
ncbi:hypothetical protein DPM35_29690 [Mesorhizobium atlanticum]|uniref:Uncharacterized protein n=1 Tax=Mesorhizobium atlanticum TaxID=2233532 RepID=A0A330GH87_9HYPH|nr:hypothetical protein DPM35_29690 [Mesorhizobium atlanticum]